MMTLVRCRALQVLFLCLLLLLPVTAFASYTFSVPVRQIQQALTLFFPLNEYAMTTRLKLYEPVVTLQQGEKYLHFAAAVKASISGEGRRRGRVVADLGLHYRAASGELFLGYPKLRIFDMDDISDEQRQTLQASLADVLLKTLPMVRIYRVHESDLNHTLAKSEIKAMRIDDGILWVTIGFD